MNHQDQMKDRREIAKSRNVIIQSNDPAFNYTFLKKTETPESTGGILWGHGEIFYGNTINKERSQERY